MFIEAHHLGRATGSGLTRSLGSLQEILGSNICATIFKKLHFIWTKTGIVYWIDFSKTPRQCVQHN